MEDRRFYLTTTLPYVNGDPHMGHALEFVHADIIARYNRFLGADVFLNIGTDEHGQKIYQKAQEGGKTPKEYTDFYAERFRFFAKALCISNNNFIRTTDEHHIKAAREFWIRCDNAGYIGKKKQKIKYCVGCELEKVDSELEDGRCITHPNLQIEVREEENYFFKLSQFKDRLLALYNKNSDFVIPTSRFNEIYKFVERGLNDFSISRLAEKMPWGVPVPNDSEHIMYVWFDALVSYISSIGWPGDDDTFKKWWPVIQFAGKDQLRPQIVMWQAMLMAAGLMPSKKILIHGFITTEGQKMSKSLGNVVDPTEIIKKYGVDALRYYLAREITTFEDGDFTLEKFKEAYNANLANGLGNLVSRIMKMAETHLLEPVSLPEVKIYYKPSTDAFEKYNIQNAADKLWKYMGTIDAEIQEREPYKMIKINPEKAKEEIKKKVVQLWQVAHYVSPFLPETSEKIKDAIKENRMPDVLFKRID